MTSDSTYSEIERVIRQSEVMAVVRALPSNHAPSVGDALDYFIELGPQNKAGKPYRFTVEQWHLDAARQMAADAASDPAGGAQGRRLPLNGEKLASS